MRAHPHLYEISTWPWLERLSVAAGRRVTLGTVPDREWDRLQALGFDLIFLMGVWERSAISRQVARSEPGLFGAYDRARPDWTPADIVGSPYSIRDYAPDQQVGTWEDLDRARKAINDRGMALVLDFVPNHTAFDHRWIATHPHRYVTATLEQFRAAPGDFRAVDTDHGPMYIACGRDPYFPPWTDVAQLNYFDADTREAMLRELGRIAEHCDGVRCDMAMLVLDDVFARTWGAIVGANDPPGEFWSEVKADLPDLLLLAEAYWDLEPRLQQLGMSLTYDKPFYDALAAGSATSLRARLGGEAAFQARSVRFLENHDEARSYAVFGPERIEAAAVVHATSPGIRMYYDGQLEGRRVYSPVQLRQWAEESQHPDLASLYARLLKCANELVFHEGTFELLRVDPAEGSSEGLLAFWWHSGSERRLIVANIAKAPSEGIVRLPSFVSGEGALVFEDQVREGEWRRDLATLARDGLRVALPGGRAHLLHVHHAGDGSSPERILGRST